MALPFIIAGVAGAVAAGIGVKKSLDNKSETEILKTHQVLYRLGGLLLSLGDNISKNTMLSENLIERLNEKKWYQERFEYYLEKNSAITKLIDCYFSHYSAKDNISDRKYIAFSVWGSQALDELNFMSPEEWANKIYYQEISNSDIKTLSKYIDKIEKLTNNNEQFCEDCQFYVNYLSMVSTRESLDDYKEGILEAIENIFELTDSLIEFIVPIQSLLEDNADITESLIDMRISLSNTKISLSGLLKTIFDRTHTNKLFEK